MTALQASIDAQTAAVNQLASDFSDFVTTVDADLTTANTEIADLVQKLADLNISYDFTALTTAVGGMSTAVAAAKAALPAVLPETPATPPASTPSA